MDNCEELVNPFYTALHDELHSDSLNFPTSFSLIPRAMEVIDNVDSTVKDYARFVQSEPVLLAKVLRMANSVAMNPYGREITGAFEAVQRLGSKKIRCLVYLVTMEQMRQDVRSNELKKVANVVWQHSLDVASLSYCISKHTKIADPDESLLAGLMIDIGQFFIISKLPNFPEIVRNQECCIDLIKSDHLQIAKQLMDIMMLPSVIIHMYNSKLKNFPVWPMSCMCDVVTLSNIHTEYKNPYLKDVDALKRCEFDSELEPDESDAIVTMLEEIDVDRLALFNSLSGS